jgi:hypothetical protein
MSAMTAMRILYPQDCLLPSGPYDQRFAAQNSIVHMATSTGYLHQSAWVLKLDARSAGTNSPIAVSRSGGKITGFVQASGAGRVDDYHDG